MDAYTLPVFAAVDLTAEQQRRERYSIPFKHLPSHVKKQLKAVASQWMRAENTSCALRAVQSTTIAKQLDALDVMRGYMGYVAKKFHVTPGRLGLAHYGDTLKLASFFGYLKVGCGVTVRAVTCACALLALSQSS
jgi:hypothetical protein